MAPTFLNVENSLFKCLIERLNEYFKTVVNLGFELVMTAFLFRYIHFIWLCSFLFLKKFTASFNSYLKLIFMLIIEHPALR